MPYRAVFLDAFNTLWYVKRSATQIWHELLAEMSEDRSIEQIRAAEKKEQNELLERWTSLETSERPNALAVIEAVWEDYDTKIMNHLGLSVDRDTLRSEITPRFFDMLALFDETKEVLETLRSQGYHIAIVSNGGQQESIAKHLGVGCHFDAIVGSWHVGVRKPMPEIFRMALSSLGVTPEQAIMVGDNRDDDVMGATGVGIKGIHLNRSNEAPLSGDAIEDLWGVVRFLQGQSQLGA